MTLTFSIGVAACVREHQITSSSNSLAIFQYAINKGAFSSSGVNILNGYRKGLKLYKRPRLLIFSKIYGQLV